MQVKKQEDMKMQTEDLKKQGAAAWSREAPFLAEADVVVVGGGFSGVCAAVGAARAGAKAIIVERDGMLGGQAAEVYTFGLDAVIHYASGRHIIRGLPLEIIRRTAAEGQSDPLWDRVDFERTAREGVEPVMREHGLKPRGTEDAYIAPAAFRYVLQTMADEAGVTTLLECPLVGALRDGDRVTGVVVQTEYGPRALTGKVVVDTTPQAAVAGLAGKPFPRPEAYIGTHPRVANVDIHRLIAYLRKNPGEFECPPALAPGADGMAALVEKDMSLRLVGFETAWKRAVAADPAYAVTKRAAWGGGPLLFFYDRDGCGSYWVQRGEGRETRLDDPLLFSRMLTELRRRQWLTHKIFREYVPGFERAHLVDMCPHIARALKMEKVSAGFTEYDVTWDEVTKGGSPHADSVARLMGHPGYGQAADGWQLPYRALIPKGLDGVLVTGKPAFGWIHYNVTVAAVGHAAGVAAAVAARTGGPLREVAAGAIQDELRRQDASI